MLFLIQYRCVAAIANVRNGSKADLGLAPRPSFEFVEFMVGGGSEDSFDALRASIHLSPIATLVTDNRLDDNPIVEVNDAFLSLTGYSREEVIGRNCRFLAGPGTEPECREELRAAVAEGRPALAELTNYRKNGTAFRNAVMFAPILDQEGDVALFIGSQMDAGPGGSQSILRSTRARELVETLSPRLRQTLELMASGYRNKQIGGVLGIEEKTVKMHRARLLQALDVKSSADAIRIAIEAGLELPVTTDGKMGDR